MPRTPPSGPHGTVKVGDRVLPVTLSRAVLDWITDGVRTNETNIGSLNSGVAQVRADAAAAQSTANAANQGVADVQAAVVDVSGGGTVTFSATVDPFNAFGGQVGTGAVTTNAVTVSVSGGTGPFTYLWTYVSGYAGFTANTDTLATTTFSGTLTLPGQDRTGVWRCTVTDTFDSSTVSVPVGVNISELS